MSPEACPICGAPIPPGAPPNYTCFHRPQGQPDPRHSPSSACSLCGGSTSRETIDFRIGGHSGPAIFFFGDLAEAGEGVLSLAARTCHSCGHIDFYRA